MYHVLTCIHRSLIDYANDINASIGIPPHDATRRRPACIPENELNRFGCQYLSSRQTSSPAAVCSDGGTPGSSIGDDAPQASALVAAATATGFMKVGYSKRNTFSLPRFHPSIIREPAMHALKNLLFCRWRSQAASFSGSTCRLFGSAGWQGSQRK